VLLVVLVLALALLWPNLSATRSCRTAACKRSPTNWWCVSARFSSSGLHL